MENFLGEFIDHIDEQGKCAPVIRSDDLTKAIIPDCIMVSCTQMDYQ